MKKGFTLIELLAVIIILAIIALIATPIVLDVVDDAKNSAAKSEAAMIVSGVNNYCAASAMKEQLNGTPDICKDGVSKEEVSTMVDLGNAVVTDVTYNGKVTSLKIESNNRVVTYDGNTYKIDGEIIDTPETTYTEALLNGADPVLDEGMIPVVIANDGSLTKADLKNEWYKYEDKKWANVVLVTESSRNGYIEAEPGNEIKQEDVLAYYVWIPRYRYQIFSTKDDIKMNQDSSLNVATATVIDIVFEDKYTTKSTGTIKGEYVTHPAFTFGEDELNGMWVGKFETTGYASSPTILPNVMSLRAQNVATQFTTSLKFANNTLNSDGSITHTNNNVYGINETDAHMMKNTEWGAVAYLSNSKYGRCLNGVCDEIRINNSSKYITGCAATVAATTKTLTEYLEQTDHSEGYYAGCENAYNTETGILASTTGNITGIYDMSGGAWEHMMAVIGNENNEPLSGRHSSWNGGFNGPYGCASCATTDGYGDATITEKTDGIPFPASKYYDLYEYGTTRDDIAAYKRGKVGDATYELGYFYQKLTRNYSNWNNDYTYIVMPSVPWFMRGSRYDFGLGSGIFAASYDSGSPSGDFSFRSVLVNN